MTGRAGATKRRGTSRAQPLPARRPYARRAPRARPCTGPEAIEVFKSKAFDSSHLAALSPLVAGSSVLSQDGEAHRHLRSALNGPFVPRGLSAGTVGPMMAGVLGELCAGFCARGEARVTPEVKDAALAIIFRMIGLDPRDLPAWRARYRDLLLANLGSTAMFPGSPAWRAARARRWIDERLQAIVTAARMGAPEDKTLVGALARATDEDGKALTDAELLDNLRLLVLGGHETISAIMAWMILTLCARPDLWDALLAEVGEGAATPGCAARSPRPCTSRPSTRPRGPWSTSPRRRERL